jgi:beta-phosphoglucomutase-like phosphatase (HAD superfamily)
MGVLAGKCIVFEDVLPAVRGAKLGNFFTVAVEDEASAADREAIREAADLYITSYEELINHG